MIFKQKIIFSVLMFGLVSPQLMAATVDVTAATGSTVSAVLFNINTLVRPNQFNSMSHEVVTPVSNQFISQSIASSQNDFSSDSPISLGSPGVSTVAISAVPIPAALWLFLPAILAFLGLRQRSLIASRRVAVNS